MIVDDPPYQFGDRDAETFSLALEPFELRWGEDDVEAVFHVVLSGADRVPRQETNSPKG